MDLFAIARDLIKAILDAGRWMLARNQVNVTISVQDPVSSIENPGSSI
jgi:hypothetical protein